MCKNIASRFRIGKTPPNHVSNTESETTSKIAPFNKLCKRAIGHPTRTRTYNDTKMVQNLCNAGVAQAVPENMCPTYSSTDNSPKPI